MKNQITTLIIGILIGAVISTGIFLVLKDKDKNKMPNMGERGQISEKRRDFNNSNSNNNNRPDNNNKPSTENTEKTEENKN